MIAAADTPTKTRYAEFFVASIRNKHTRNAYMRASGDFFAWRDAAGIQSILDVETLHVAAYIEEMTKHRAAQTVKQHLAGIRALFDYLVTGGMLTGNPASAVRGPKHSTTKGKTPVLFAEGARALLQSIPIDNLAGLRDRAIISVMIYGFARVSAALGMDVGDAFRQHHRLWLRLHEKGGKYHQIPCHHNLEDYLQSYIDAAELGDRGPLFRTLPRRCRGGSSRP